MVTHSGGCHCGRIRFEVDAPARLTVSNCNCSICTKSGYRHLLVPANRFRQLSGQDALTTYSFNTHTARHLFCATCGIKAFYIPRSNPDGFSVNANCIDSDTIEELIVRDTDGRNWEATHAKGTWSHEAE